MAKPNIMTPNTASGSTTNSLVIRPMRLSCLCSIKSYVDAHDSGPAALQLAYHLTGDVGGRPVAVNCQCSGADKTALADYHVCGMLKAQLRVPHTCNGKCHTVHNDAYPDDAGWLLQFGLYVRRQAGAAPGSSQAYYAVASGGEVCLRGYLCGGAVCGTHVGVAQKGYNAQFRYELLLYDLN